MIEIDDGEEALVARPVVADDAGGTRVRRVLGLGLDSDRAESRLRREMTRRTEQRDGARDLVRREWIERVAHGLLCTKPRGEEKRDERDEPHGPASGMGRAVGEPAG